VDVLGVDGYQRGWVGVGWYGSSVAAAVAPTIAALVEGFGDVAVVAIDMPIGLPTTGRRQADLDVRRFLGVRRSTVFFTPTRAAMEMTTYTEANAAARAAEGGLGLSRQSYALRAKLLDVDTWVRTARMEVREVHPEACFAVMAGGPLASSKATWRGVHERRALLQREGIELPDDLGPAGVAGVDDVLDAAAACWSARRIATGAARSFPDPPEPLDGLAAAIWA
jgi:predicted RNase H-like nuclease